ncbi:MAG: hypothetical protein BWY04_01440 [candidate division CPR1 bacterium ADurb.Bin160]|jgi:hypothetical protein|uniref:Uncharacterized protein n=1 Tax=candidate division CPR1 bacterium ADurb.Bin160 TaxID=1852826 RepID=A0A1V5ZIV8_9BACT|nr:MAG: hypothetical protein BWY04_01440 [candidate division CPR1 bacterium ADurb.Bin160]
MRYKEQAKTNKEYINDPSLQKNLIKIEHPIQKFFYVNESRLDAKKEGNGKNYKETNFIVTLPSNSKRNNTDLYRELFKEKRTNKEEKYGVRA